MYWSSARRDSVCMPVVPSAQEANRQSIWAQDSLANMRPCLSYFSTAVKRHHNQENLWKETFNWGLLTVSEGEVHDHHGWEQGGSQALTGSAAQNLHLICKLEAETGPGVGVWRLKAHLPGHTPSKATPLHPFQTVPPIEIYKFMEAILTQTLLTHILRLTEA